MIGREPVSNENRADHDQPVMRVCLAHGTVGGHSGSGRYIVDVATRFAEDHHAVTVICHETDASLENYPGIEIVTLPRPSGRFGTWRLGHLLQFRVIKRSLLRLLKNRHFDVLIGSDLLFLKPIKDFYGSQLRFIYTPLSMIAPLEIETTKLGGLREWLGVRLYAGLQRWALTTADRVVRFTESAVKALERYYRLDLAAKKLVAVYVSREFEQAPADQAHPISFDRPEPRELLWVGRLIEIKNIDFLLRAVALVRSTNWILNVCSDGPDRPRLEALATSMGVTDRVRFLGSLNDLGAVYSRASLFLTASLNEQYSLTLMEAYAFGVPILGLRPDWDTVLNSNEDQIIDGVTGYLIADERDMAMRIDELLVDEPKRQQMAREAYEMKKRGFSFELFFQALSGAATGAISK
jgi:glycosyltransferase involved in cell wall biosynthesis